MLGMFTKILMQSNGTFRKAVDSIINFAKDTYRSIFSREEAKTIKSVMEAFGKNKEDYRAIGTFLVFTADKKRTYPTASTARLFAKWMMLLSADMNRRRSVEIL